MRFTRSMRPRVRGVFALLLCGAVSACDVRDLTAPTPAVVTGSPRAASASGGIALGTATVAPPPNTSPAEVSKLGYYELGISLPESSWVMVHVSGGVNLLWNPACADMPPYWPCMDSSPTTSYGESPGFGGPVQLFNVANGVSSAVRLRGSGGAGTTPASAVGIFFQGRPGPLVGHVSMTAVYAHNSINGGGTPSWLVTGGYTVTATQIDAPFTVTESAPEPDGTRTYTAEPLPGLRFSNFPTSGQFPPGAAFWSFYPDDSPPDRSWPGWPVPGCQYQLVCRYRPAVPGRMQVNAFVEWQRAIVRSKPEGSECPASTSASSLAPRATCVPPPPDPRLRVRCTPRPERGSRVVCSAKVEPEMPFTVVLRAATGNNIAIVDTLNEPHAAGDSASWAGTAVTTSRVRFTAEVNVEGVAKQITGSARFEVTKRPWTPYRIVSPTVVHRLHYQLNPAPPPYGVMNLTTYSYDTTPVDSVPDGPNRGAVYFAQQLQFDGNVAVINLHPAVYGLQPPGPVGVIAWIWFNDQNGNAGPHWYSNPLHIHPPCTQAQMPKLRSELERHEGVTVTNNSHVGVANRLFQTTKLHEQFERFYTVNGSVNEFRQRAWFDYTDWYTGPFMSAQRQFDATDTNQVWAAAGCQTDDDLTAP